VLLTGTPLENLFTCEEWLTEGNLARLLASNHGQGTPRDGWGEARKLVEPLYRHVAALSTAAGGFQLLLSAGEEDRRAAEWLVGEGAHYDPRVAAFREVAAFLLSLDVEGLPELWSGPTPDRDQQDVGQALERMRSELDQLERRVNHRGNWPR
jgi:hypothetical protein